MIRTPALCLFGFTLCVAAYLGFSLIHLPHDKTIHFVTFFLLTGEFYFVWDIRRPWRITFLAITLGASVMLEYAQNIINPNRAFDHMDIAYNVLGSSLALVLCCLWQSWLGRHRRVVDVEIRSPSPVTPLMSDDEDYVVVRMNELEDV